MDKLTSIHALIKQHQVIAKKSLGQNFLVDEEVFSKIDHLVSNLKDQDILEIGPGLGSLTRIILDSSAKSLTSIEKDTSFIAILQPLCTLHNTRYNLIEADALNIDEKEIFADKFSIVSNLPYNIGTVLLIKWLKIIDSIDTMYLMFQREVAERIVATPGSKAYGRLSILVGIFCEAELLFDIEPNSFIPPPKITSSFVKIKARSKPLYDVNLCKLEKLTKTVFGMRRKMLRKSLKSICEDPESLVKNTDIELSKRPEDLTIEQFCVLASRL